MITLKEVAEYIRNNQYVLHSNSMIDVSLDTSEADEDSKYKVGYLCKPQLKVTSRDHENQCIFRLEEGEQAFSSVGELLLLAFDYEKGNAPLFNIYIEYWDDLSKGYVKVPAQEVRIESDKYGNKVVHFTAYK